MAIPGLRIETGGTQLFVERRMIVALPAQVARGFVHGLRDVAEVGGHVVLEALAADVLEQLLQLRESRPRPRRRRSPADRR